VRRTSIRLLLVVAVGAAGVSLFVIRALAAHGTRLPPVAWIEDAAIAALAVFIFWLGWSVRAYQKGKRPTLDPLRAARTLVLAKSGALTGAILTGRYLATVLDVTRDLAIESQRAKAIAAGIAVLCSLALVVASLLAEKFCQLPPLGDDPAEGQPGLGPRGPEVAAG
jgi:hypothetical protein